MQIYIFFILGLALGSFINALTWRIRAGWDMIKDRSRCVHCKHTLEWYDLLPVISWIVLRARCRYCKKPISAQYPLVEIGFGLFLAGSYHFWPSNLITHYDYAYFGLWIIAGVILTTLLIYDLRWMLLPDKLVYPLALISLLALSIVAQTNFNELSNHILAGFLAWVFFYILYIVSKGRWIGGGDIKLAPALGLWLTPTGVLTWLMLAFYSATLVVLPLLIFRAITRKQPVPFGPFLILGFVVAFIWGTDIKDWYLNLVLPY